MRLQTYKTDFSTSGINVLLFCIVFAVSACISPVFASPVGDTYFVSSRNLADDIQNSSLLFGSGYTVPSAPAGLTKIKASIRPFQGIVSGVEVIRADGTSTNVSSWSESGYVIEFTLATTDGDFISFSPYSDDWGLLLQDIDLEPLPDSDPQVTGIYFDLSNSFQELPYILNPAYLSEAPIGVGKHPYNIENDVLYVTETGEDFDNYAFAGISNNKLTLNIDSHLQFDSYSLANIISGTGISSNFNQDPKVNVLKIGILVKGLQVNQEILLPGDFNCDLKVDLADYTVWRDNLGNTNADPCSGDADNDGDADNIDYSIWRSNFGMVYQPPASVAFAPPGIPEDSAGGASVIAAEAPNNADAGTPNICTDNNQSSQVAAAGQAEVFAEIIPEGAGNTILQSGNDRKNKKKNKKSKKNKKKKKKKLRKKKLRQSKFEKKL